MKRDLFLIAIAALLLAPNFMKWDINGHLPFNGKEKYDPNLSFINSVDKLESYIDNKAAANGINTQTVQYVIETESAIKDRFYHDFSHFSLNQNWIAALTEKITGIGLSCKLLPDDILRDENAACSQQSIVMMEVLKRKGISYRKVGFPHHYALEAEVNNNWYYFDPNMEPDISPNQRMEENWKCCADNLKKFYNPEIYTNLNYQFGVKNVAATFGPINEKPAPRARLFQSVSGVLSWTAWCFPLLLVLYRRRVKTPLLKLSFSGFSFKKRIPSFSI